MGRIFFSFYPRVYVLKISRISRNDVVARTRPVFVEQTGRHRRIFNSGQSEGGRSSRSDGFKVFAAGFANRKFYLYTR